MLSRAVEPSLNEDAMMTHFPIHTRQTAPEQSKPHLDGLQQAFGFIPNVAGAMATSPVLTGSLAALFGRVHSGSFSEAEIQVVLLTNAVTNRSAWPAAFHSYLAAEQGIDMEDIRALRAGRELADARLAALSSLARRLIRQKGHLTSSDKDEFLAVGYRADQLLEVIAIVAASTITNYTASVTMPVLEEEFAAYAWNAP